MKSVFISPFRFYFIFFAVSVSFCSLGGRLIYLQVFRANDFTDIASGTRKNIVTLKARRGDIVDSKGNLMATTRSVVDIGIDPQSIKVGDNDKLLKLSKILSLEPQVIESAVRKKIKKGDN